MKSETPNHDPSAPEGGELLADALDDLQQAIAVRWRSDAESAGEAFDPLALFDEARRRLSNLGMTERSFEVDEFGLDAHARARARNLLDFLADRYWRIDVSGAEGAHLGAPERVGDFRSGRFVPRGDFHAPVGRGTIPLVVRGPRRLIVVVVGVSFGRDASPPGRGRGYPTRPSSFAVPSSSAAPPAPASTLFPGPSRAADEVESAVPPASSGCSPAARWCEAAPRTCSSAAWT